MTFFRFTSSQEVRLLASEDFYSYFYALMPFVLTRAYNYGLPWPSSQILFRCSLNRRKSGAGSVITSSTAMKIMSWNYGVWLLCGRQNRVYQESMQPQKSLTRFQAKRLIQTPQVCVRFSFNFRHWLILFHQPIAISQSLGL
jgi:hypothetical protein